MKHLITTIITKLNTTKLGIGAVAALSGVTALAVIPSTPWGQELINGVFTALPDPVPADPVFATTDQHGVKIEVKQSQSKIVQNGNEEVYLDINLGIPTITELKAKDKPTDLVLVLDRSGSMGDENKMKFAKEAMKTFLNALNAQDKIALVIFDGVGEIAFPMTSVSATTKARMRNVINELGPGGSTNMGEGLDVGGKLLTANKTTRSRRIVLLSDGHANTGISDAQGLAKIVRQVTNHSVVVSTVGLGNDFNEDLLAKLSDYGMGNFTYLESVANLGEALRRDLANAREMFAHRSHLILNLGKNVSINDAAGYPIEDLGQGSFRIPMGQLLEGSQRSVTLSLKAADGNIGKHQLAKVELAYNRDGKDFVTNHDKTFEVVVVEPSRQQEAYASKDPGLLSQIWSINNIGRVKKEYSENIRKGNKDAANKVLNDYKTALREQEKAVGQKLAAPAAIAELADMENEADDAFSGSAYDQQRKQKSLSKKSFAAGLKSQRRFKKNNK